MDKMETCVYEGEKLLFTYHGMLYTPSNKHLFINSKMHRIINTSDSVIYNNYGVFIKRSIIVK